MTTPKTAATETREPAKTTAQELSENPVALLAGGVAVGVVIGLLLPRIAKERELLDPVGKQLAERVSAAAQAARDTGKQEISALLPTGSDAKDRVSALFGTVIEAARGTAKA